MDSLPVVIICSMQPERNDGYVRAIHGTHHIWYLMEVLEFLCKFIHNGGRKPSDEFLEQTRFYSASWPVKRPILYKYAMLCMELFVANLKMNTTILTWTGTANRMFISCLCKNGARVLHKYSNVDTFMRIRPLNSLALNDPSRFWSKKPGRCNPFSWAHNRRGRGPWSRMYPSSARVMKQSCCHCQTKIAPSSLDMVSRVVNKDNWKTNKIISFWNSGSVFWGWWVSDENTSWFSSSKREAEGEKLDCDAESSQRWLLGDRGFSMKPGAGKDSKPNEGGFWGWEQPRLQRHSRSATTVCKHLPSCWAPEALHVGRLVTPARILWYGLCHPTRNHSLLHQIACLSSGKGLSQCKMDVKSTWMTIWHQMDHVFMVTWIIFKNHLLEC